MTIRANQLLGDAVLKATDALPASSTTVNGTAIDLGDAMTGRGARRDDCELLLSAPVLSTTQLPDGNTAKYSIQGSLLANFATVVPLATTVLTQTGAGGAGAAASSARIKLPSDCPRYVRASVITVSGNCALASMILALVF